MYFDIIAVNEPDEYGNTITRYEPVTVTPGYPDITPKDMSLSNQMKAGINPDSTGLLPIGDKLNAADSATGDLIRHGEQLIEVEAPTSKRSKSTKSTVDPTSDPEPKEPKQE